jgi:hypothetical protein
MPFLCPAIFALQKKIGHIKCLTEGEEKYRDRIIELYYEDLKKLEEYKNKV